MKTKKLTNLFVSADLPNDHLFVAFARYKNVHLLAHSLITFQALNNTTTADYSVVFFSIILFPQRRVFKLFLHELHHVIKCKVLQLPNVISISTKL